MIGEGERDISSYQYIAFYGFAVIIGLIVMIIVYRFIQEMTGMFSFSDINMTFWVLSIPLILLLFIYLLYKVLLDGEESLPERLRKQY